MTDADFAEIGPGFAAYLRGFRRHAESAPTARHVPDHPDVLHQPYLISP